MRESVSETLRLMISRERAAAVLAEILADAVVDDDGVVHRVADDGEHGGDRRERDLLVEDDEDADDDHRVVDARDDDARREPQVEAEREVEHDEDDRDRDRVARAVAELLAGLRADPLHAQRVLGHRVGAELFLERPFDELVALALELHLDAVVARVDDLRVRRARADASRRARCGLAR